MTDPKVVYNAAHAATYCFMYLMLRDLAQHIDREDINRWMEASEQKTQGQVSFADSAMAEFAMRLVDRLAEADSKGAP